MLNIFMDGNNERDHRREFAKTEIERDNAVKDALATTSYIAREAHLRHTRKMTSRIDQAARRLSPPLTGKE